QRCIQWSNVCLLSSLSRPPSGSPLVHRPPRPSRPSAAAVAASRRRCRRIQPAPDSPFVAAGRARDAYPSAEVDLPDLGARSLPREHIGRPGQGVRTALAARSWSLVVSIAGPRIPWPERRQRSRAQCPRRPFLGDLVATMQPCGSIAVRSWKSARLTPDALASKVMDRDLDRVILVRSVVPSAHGAERHAHRAIRLELLPPLALEL